MLKKTLFILVIIVIVVGFLIKWLLDTTHLSPLVTQFITHSEPQIKNRDGITNILLLGIGGGTHDGPNLTDTVIFVSINQQTQKITLVSIPRDLWIPDLQGKINTAYAIGQDNGQGKGLILAKATVQKILDQPIDYGFRIDFSGFEKAVDLVGGLDITVERTFDDYQYPIEGKEDDPCDHTAQEIQDWSNSASASSELTFFPCRFMHLQVDKGKQHMNGVTALRYVRSRHAQGIEGSDFARSKRQQKIIAAFKDKIFSAQTLLNPAKLISLYNTLHDSIDTDINQDDYAGFMAMAQNMKNAKIMNASLDTGDSSRPGLLINPPISAAYNNAWVLAPRHGGNDFSEIHEYVSCMITKRNCIVTQNGIITPTPIPSVAPTK